MENTGEVLTANLPIQVQAPVLDTEAGNFEQSFGDALEPELSTGESISAEENNDNPILGEGEEAGEEFVEELDAQEFAEMTEEIKSEDLAKIENIREMISQTIEARLESEIKDHNLVTRDEIAYMLMLALMLLKEEKRKGEKSLLEIIFSVVSTLIKDMFEPEKMGESKDTAEKVRPVSRVNPNNIKSLMDVFSIRQKEKSAFSLEKVAS